MVKKKSVRIQMPQLNLFTKNHAHIMFNGEDHYLDIIDCTFQRKKEHLNGSGDITNNSYFMQTKFNQIYLRHVASAK